LYNIECKKAVLCHIETSKGWTLSPAYDINPEAKLHQCLLIDAYTEQSDIKALLSASENYMLER
jgi:serine/threonine-protein kinase HipA